MMRVVRVEVVWDSVLCIFVVVRVRAVGLRLWS